MSDIRGAGGTAAVRNIPEENRLRKLCNLLTQQNEALRLTVSHL